MCVMANKCIIKGCNKFAHRMKHGICAMHYARFRRHGDYNSLRPRRITPRGVCLIKGCKKFAEGRACRMHHARMHFHGDYNYVRYPPRTKPKGVCHVPKCPKSITNGARICPMHYYRMRVHGDYDYVNPKLGKGSIRNGYRKFTVNGKRDFEHRIVWVKRFGPIPNGFDIHHKNGNRLDNRIKNLQLMSEKAHAKLHHSLRAITSA